jgi:hypothetical protein
MCTAPWPGPVEWFMELERCWKDRGGGGALDLAGDRGLELYCPDRNIRSEWRLPENLLDSLSTSSPICPIDYRRRRLADAILFDQFYRD